MSADRSVVLDEDLVAELVSLASGHEGCSADGDCHFLDGLGAGWDACVELMVGAAEDRRQAELSAGDELARQVAEGLQ